MFYKKLSAVCVFLMATDHFAQAQAPVAPAASEAALDEITVTAQKRSQNLQNVPIAINVVSADKLESAGVESVLNLNAAVPGLTLLDIGGQYSARIRGIGSTSVGVGLEAPVAMVIDDVYYATSADVAGGLADTAQVAVLKGPQGTLFGRNATGGVVQITTRDPTDEFKMDLSTGVDNYRTWRSSLYAGGPVTSDLKAGISAEYATQQDGWGRNLYNGEDVHKINSDATVRGKLIFTPTDSTTIRMSADYSHRSGSMDAAFTPFPGYPAEFASPVAPPTPWDNNTYIQPYDAYQGGGVSLNVQQELGFAKLTSISAYRRSVNDFTFTTPGTSIPALDLFLHQFASQFTEELQLGSMSQSPLNWTAGIYYIQTLAGLSPEVINIRPGPYRGTGAISQVIVDTTQNLDSIAPYGQVTYEIHQGTRITGGIRYSYEHKSLFGYENGILAADPSVSIPFVPPGTAYLTFKNPTWRASIDQDLAEGVVGYLSYNRGFKSGGFNVTDPTNPPYQPEKLDAYELGVKSEFLDNRVRLNGAVFDYEYKNVQVARYTTNTVIYNGAAARIFGMDIDATAKLTSQLQLNASVSLLHSYFTNFPDSFSSSYTLNPQGATIDLFTASATGKALPYSPSATYTLGVDYDIPSAVGLFKLNASDYFSTKYYPESDNVLTQPSYHLVSASIAWKSESTRYGVRVYANNLLNKAVVSQAGSLTTGYEADFPNPPRIYGVKFELSY